MYSTYFAHAGISTSHEKLTQRKISGSSQPVRCTQQRLFIQPISSYLQYANLESTGAAQIESDAINVHHAEIENESPGALSDMSAQIRKAPLPKSSCFTGIVPVLSWGHLRIPGK